MLFNQCRGVSRVGQVGQVTYFQQIGKKQSIGFLHISSLHSSIKLFFDNRPILFPARGTTIARAWHTGHSCSFVHKLLSPQFLSPLFLLLETLAISFFERAIILRN